MAQTYYSLPRPVRRILVLVLGAPLLAAGLAMLVLPGPGLPVIAVAFAVFALEFESAKRVAERASRLVRGIGDRLR